MVPDQTAPKEQSDLGPFVSICLFGVVGLDWGFLAVTEI